MHDDIEELFKIFDRVKCNYISATKNEQKYNVAAFVRMQKELNIARRSIKVVKKSILEELRDGKKQDRRT